MGYKIFYVKYRVIICLREWAGDFLNNIVMIFFFWDKKERKIIFL